MESASTTSTARAAHPSGRKGRDRFPTRSQPMPASAKEKPTGPAWMNWAGDEAERSDRRDLVSLGVGHELARRPVVLDLPDEMRSEERRCQGAAEPEPWITECVESTGEREAGDEAGSQQHDVDLVLEADHRDPAERQPEPAGPAGKDPRRDACETGPDQDVEAVHRVDREQTQIDRRRGGERLGQEARPPAPTQLARRVAYQKHGACRRESGQHAESDPRLPEEGAGGPRDQGNER